MAISADALRQVADKIDSFRTFIRRDVGNEKLRDKIERELAALGHEDPKLVDYILDLTEALRLTTVNYFTGQFDE